MYNYKDVEDFRGICEDTEVEGLCTRHANLQKQIARLQREMEEAEMYLNGLEMDINDSICNALKDDESLAYDFAHESYGLKFTPSNRSTECEGAYLRAE